MNIISCTNLSKYYSGKAALDNVSLSLEAGEPIALIGPNGAGKTTLMSVLCGYVRASNGRASVLGHPPGSAALNGRLSALPQDAQLDPRFTVNRQLRLFATLQKMRRTQAAKDVDRVLELVDLTAAKNQTPAELSHGMRKRVAIAQSLLGNPELVLLDEPTSGLDPVNVKAIRDLIVSCSQNTTFIVSSHNLDELEKLCTTIIHLDHGQLKDQVDLSAVREKGYLTIKLEQSNISNILENLQSLPGVTDIEKKQQGAIVIRYNESTHPYLDQQLLKFLADNNQTYRHIIKGRTLEDQLFF